MSFDVIKGKLYDLLQNDNNSYTEIEMKILINIRKVAIDASKVRFYLLDHFLYQTKAHDQLASTGFTIEAWYFSSLETGFYQLATNLLFNLFSSKKDKQVSIDYILGQLIDNGKMKKLSNILSDDKIIVLEQIREDFFDDNTTRFLSGLKILRDGNAAHHDINFSHPKVIKIKEVYELFYKMNNALTKLFDCLDLTSDLIINYRDKQFLWEINNHLNQNGIFK